jgi:dTDP-4-amino-4,6-dideoxygalactose transaminase
MLKRCKEFSYQTFKGEMRRLQQHQKSMVDAGIFIPGYRAEDRNFWLFPIVVENKELFIQYMIQKGVVPVKSSTQLKEVKPFSDSFEHAPMARWLMDNVIYCPIHKDVPEKDLSVIVRRLIDGYVALQQYGEQTGAKFRDEEMDKKFRLRSKL